MCHGVASVCYVVPFSVSTCLWVQVMASVQAIAVGRVIAQAGCLNWLLVRALFLFPPQRRSFIFVKDYCFDHRPLFQTSGTF